MRLFLRAFGDSAAAFAGTYEENAVLIAAQDRRFDLEALVTRLREYVKTHHRFDSPEVFVSFNLLAKKRIFCAFHENQMVFLPGYDEWDAMEYLMSRRQLPELDIIFNAPAEKNRLKILDFPVRKGEVTIHDSEQELDLTGNNAYYHLSLLLKANTQRGTDRFP